MIAVGSPSRRDRRRGGIALTEGKAVASGIAVTETAGRER